MTATTTDTPLALSPGPSGVRTVKNALATVFVTLADGARDHSAGLGALHRDHQGLPARAHPRPGGCRASAASPRAEKVAAPTTPSSVLWRWP